ncbi:ATP-binding cassette domain-containing protein [Halobacillus shinanisalinarum]|uniref:ATP-binding cassette domain-containing protein n=1 Tax=Halobacillus shinanisalinarum TaxID=2932258 RepID=A0ABY4H3Z7_9BACI|nr:ATP-binding cassette domain-containing protein [Halobacillus shinanisalinarum]UOQ95026.1 ATP-binding cassette domain-containing protein [Halobacillus shinanisalinarum]
MNETIIQTHGLLKTFKKTNAVDRVDITIKKGEIYGFLGPNGAGKTTTIRMLLGLMKPSGGSIQVFNKDLKNHKIDILRKVGSLVESPSYYEHLSGKENLETLRKLLQVPKERIDHVLSVVRLTKDAHRLVKEYSLGMKQRLGIASALLGDPELLILDEPTNGLDPSGIHEMRELIKSMPETYGITVMISSHLLSEIDQMATQVGIISKGRMIYQDSIETLRSKARPHIRLRVGNGAAAKSKLLKSGYVVESDDDYIYMEDGRDEYISELVATLVNQRIPVYRVEEQRQSLEDIFLDLTREGSGSHAAHSAS